MVLNAHTILLILGIICFLVEALARPANGVAARIGWFPLGWAFVVTSFLVF